MHFVLELKAVVCLSTISFPARVEVLLFAITSSEVLGLSA
jgi:hypothetical protein